MWILAQSEPGIDTAVGLVKSFGFPTACLIIVVWALIKGKLISEREAKKIQEDADARIKAAQDAADVRTKTAEAHAAELKKDAEDRYRELKEESIERLDNLRKEKDMWRDTALKATNLAHMAAESATKGDPK